MAYLLKKRGKFLEGHSYATGVGYSFSWTSNRAEARRFADDDTRLVGYANQTGAKPVQVENDRQELKALGRRAMLAVALAGEQGNRPRPRLP